MYVTAGLSNQEGTTDALRSLISDANRGGVSIYAVDVSGLSNKASAEAAASLPAIGFGPASGASQAGAGYKAPIPTGPSRIVNAPLRGGAFDSVGAHPDFERNAPLRQLSKDTGGVYVSESSNLRDDMNQIAEDLQTYYEAVYAPAPEPFDGHFRAVSLSVDRPHVVAQTRSGYYWMPTAGGLKVQAFEIPLIKALDGEHHDDSLPFAARILRFGSDGVKTTTALALQLPL